MDWVTGTCGNIPFSTLKYQDLLCGSHNLPFNGCYGSPEASCQFNHLSPTIVKIMKECNYMSTLLYAFMPYTGTGH